MPEVLAFQHGHRQKPGSSGYLPQVCGADWITRHEKDEALKASMVDQVNVGVCQNLQSYDIEHNIVKSATMVDQAADKGADIVVFTEMFSTPYEPKAIRSAEQFSMKVLDVMKTKALGRKIHIVAGSLPWTSQGNRLFNRAHVIRPDGEIIYHHDKIHLFDCTPPGGPSVRESETIAPGSSLDISQHLGERFP